MASSVTIKINKEGIGELLHSDPLRDDLVRRMRRVESAARGANAHGEDAHYELAVEEHRTRTVVRVSATGERALYLETQTGSLARNLHQAGGA